MQFQDAWAALPQPCAWHTLEAPACVPHDHLKDHRLWKDVMTEPSRKAAVLLETLRLVP